MDSQWTDNFHDKFKNVIMGGPLNDLRSVFMYHGDTFEDGLIYSESHDEVGNEDKRIAKVARDGKGWEMNQISLTGTVLGRGIPMAFMGQEAGEVKQFHIDGWGDRLDLDDYTDNAARNKIVKWYKRMNDIRRDDLWTFAADSIDITHIHDDNGVVAFTRNGGEYLVVLNFKGKTWSNYGVGVSGNYKEIANTSWPQYNIGEIPQASRGMGTNTIHNVHIPAYGAVVLQRQ